MPRSARTVLLAPVLSAGTLAALAYPVVADTPSSAPAHAPPAVAYLVTGWDQSRPILAPSEAVNVVAWLAQNGTEVRTCWWNSLHPRRGQNPGPWPHPFWDRRFVRDLSAELDALPDDTQVILIGHSFGGDSLLKVAARTHHRIRFLGLLDPTGAFGLRSRTLGRRVPANVDTLWNRWQRSSPAPLDFFRRGRLRFVGEPAASSDQQRANVRGWSAHDHLQSDPAVERDLLAALDRLSGWPKLSDGGPGEVTLPAGGTLERELSASDPNPGDHLRFHLETDPPEALGTGTLAADVDGRARLTWRAPERPGNVELRAYVENDGWPRGPRAGVRSPNPDGDLPPLLGTGGKWAVRSFRVHVRGTLP